MIMGTGRMIAGYGVLLASLLMSAAQGQEEGVAVDAGSLQAETEALREALGLNARTGLFNSRAGDISPTYLAGQGVVLELVTPLGARRGLISRDTVTASLRELSQRLEAMPSIEPPDIEALRETMALSVRRDEAAEYYRSMVEKISQMDFSAEIEEAIGTMSDTARALQEAGLPQAPQLDVAAEMRRLREALGEQKNRLDSLVEELRENSSASTDVPPQELQSRWEQQLEALEAEMEPLRQAANARAMELGARLQALREERELQWQNELGSFETRLFKALCEQDNMARLLPDDEHLTLILNGLGQEQEGERQDRIHVLKATDLQRCAAGNIDAEALQRLATSYSY